MTDTSGFGIPEIEQGVVSAMMQWPDQIDHITSMLSAKHFHHPYNRVLFSEVESLFKSGVKFDLVLFTQMLRDHKKLSQAGNAHYVTSTWLNTCHSRQIIDFYIDRILEEHERQDLVTVCSRSIESVNSGDEDAVPRAITAISKVQIRRIKKDRTMAEAADEKLDRLENGRPDGDVILTGIEKIDTLSPLRKGDMPLISGKKKSGKSIFALSIATNVAKSGTKVVYFSLEDREPKVFDRIFSGISRLPLSATHVGKMTPFQTDKASTSLIIARDLPITIIDDPCSLQEIISRSRGLVARGAGLLVVDYAQLVRCPGQDSRREEVEKVSRDLRLLAMELDVPLILICQLNKEGGTRESATMEMDATAAWQIEAPEEELDEADEDYGKRFIRIPWQRNGPSGISFAVSFLGHIARVENFRATNGKHGTGQEEWKM